MEPEDLEDYSVAGCQEPLIMGKDNGNTTNSWLNMAKVLELSLNGGVSTISGRKFGKSNEENGYKAVSYTHLDVYKRQQLNSLKIPVNFYLLGFLKIRGFHQKIGGQHEDD